MGVVKTVHSIILNLVTLTSTNYATKSIVGVHQLAHIYMTPGIEPGNLIRPTLIRSPPGVFFCYNCCNGRPVYFRRDFRREFGGCIEFESK